MHWLVYNCEEPGSIFFTAEFSYKQREIEKGKSKTEEIVYFLLILSKLVITFTQPSFVIFNNNVSIIGDKT